MSERTNVVRVSIEADGKGLVCEIAVARDTWPMTEVYAEDVPPDVREALRRWLARSDINLYARAQAKAELDVTRRAIDTPERAGEREGK